MSACACTAADVCCCIHVCRCRGTCISHLKTCMYIRIWIGFSGSLYIIIMVAFFPPPPPPPCAVQVNQLFDNGGTVFFAIVMSFWGERLFILNDVCSFVS